MNFKRKMISSVLSFVLECSVVAKWTDPPDSQNGFGVYNTSKVSLNDLQEFSTTMTGSRGIIVEISIKTSYLSK